MRLPEAYILCVPDFFLPESVFPEISFFCISISLEACIDQIHLLISRSIRTEYKYDKDERKIHEPAH